VEEWTKKDPLIRYQAWLEEHGVADRAEIEAIQAKGLAEIDEATEAAEKSPTPDPASALLHVYVEEE
jgi:2-oxoisovalerate dehydrogenase E1 component alpha subunit